MKRFKFIFFVLICGLFASCGKDVSVSEDIEITEDCKVSGNECDSQISFEVVEAEAEDEETIYEISSEQKEGVVLNAPEMKEYYSNWNDAYLDFIEYHAFRSADESAKFLKKDPTIADIEWLKENNGYSLIYIDDDDIPELFISSNSFAGGCDVATFYDNKCVYWHLRDSSFLYTPYGGYMFTYAKGQVYITELCKGQFDIKMWGECHIFYPDGNYENEMREYFLGIDRIEASEEEYNEAISKYLDLNKADWADDNYQYEEIVSVLQSGHTRSDNHSYEFVVDDVSWDDAFKRAKENGGYLAILTSDEEYGEIRQQMENEQLTDILFYVAFEDNKDGFPERWVYPNGTREAANVMLSDHYQYDDSEFPDDYKTDFQVGIEGREVGIMKYSKTDKDLYLYICSDNLPEYDESFSGMTGYIIEYDN